jgi:YjbE family integral membrane protein
MDIEVLTSVAKIVALDLVLSGDNAVVIGMAANRLSEKNRRRAILVGGGGAVVLRIIFTIMVSILLSIPLLRAFGGVMLIWIAWRLAKPHAPEDVHVNEASTLGEAIKTIIIADAIMSLDNMLAVGGAAEGHLWLLIFGLALSIPILLFGSDLVARMIGRLPVLSWLGVLILMHTAIHMTVQDPYIKDIVGHIGQPVIWTLALAGTAILFMAYGRNQTPPPDPALS